MKDLRVSEEPALKPLQAPSVTCLTIWLGHLMRICMGHQLSSAIWSRNHWKKQEQQLRPAGAHSCS